MGIFKDVRELEEKMHVVRYDVSVAKRRHDQHETRMAQNKKEIEYNAKEFRALIKAVSDEFTKEIERLEKNEIDGRAATEPKKDWLDRFGATPFRLGFLCGGLTILFFKHVGDWVKLIIPILADTFTWMSQYAG